MGFAALTRSYARPFRRRPVDLGPVQPFAQKYFSFVFSEIMFLSGYPASIKGAYRDRHERGARDAVGVSGCSVSDLARTNIPMRTVKPCGPGIPVLMPSSRRRFADDGGKNAGPRGELGAAVQTIAQGRPVVWPTCGDCRLLFFCRRAMGAGLASGLPCALVKQGDLEEQSSGVTRRENAATHTIVMPSNLHGRVSLPLTSPYKHACRSPSGIIPSCRHASPDPTASPAPASAGAPCSVV